MLPRFSAPPQTDVISLSKYIVSSELSSVRVALGFLAEKLLATPAPSTIEQLKGKFDRPVIESALSILVERGVVEVANRADGCHLYRLKRRA